MQFDRRISFAVQWAGLCAGLWLVSVPGEARADRWPDRKGNCEQVFQDWRINGVAALRKCTRTWEMYRDVTKVDSDQRAIVQEAFDKLYQQGQRGDAVLALSALKRLGLRPTQLRPETAAIPEVKRERGHRVQGSRSGGLGMALSPDGPAPMADPEPVDEMEERPPNPRAAKAAYRDGQAAYKRDRVDEALSQFLIATDEDPTFAQAFYMAARCFARSGNARAALDYLQQMKALGSDTARRLTRKAATDTVFRRMTRAGAFKDLTGTAIVQILTGAGPEGEAEIRKWGERLTELGMAPPELGRDNNPRTNHYIYAKPGFKKQSEYIRRQLKMGMVHKRQIDWPTDFDIIIIHGRPKKVAWVDDEAEKNESESEKKKRAEEAAKKKKDEAQMASRAKMREKLQMMKMMQQMDAEQKATGAAQSEANTVLPP